MGTGWTVEQLSLDDLAPAAPAPEPAPKSVPGSPGPRPGETSDCPLSVGAFFSRARAALSRAFPDEIWVTGEVRKVTDRRGSQFIELADHAPEPGEDPRQLACLDVACWSREWPAIAKQLRQVGLKLEPGLVVRVRGRASVWEGGGRLRLTMTALDVEALLGGIAAARARLMAALRAEGLFESNRRLPVPIVPLRVGLVTSRDSEARRDFTGRLEASGFRFEVVFEHSAVQGIDAPPLLAAALRRLRSAEVDLAVLVRGGGGRGDLVAFDSEVVARAIVGAPFPVWTGIGHTGDRSVADEVANRALITPSACGEALVARVAEYWDGVQARARLLSARVCGQLDRRDAELAGSARRAVQAASHQLERQADLVRDRGEHARRGSAAVVARAEQYLAARAAALESAGRHLLASSGREVDAKRELLRAFDPRRQMERGWTMTRDEQGRPLRSVDGVRAGARLVTVFADGEAESAVTSVRPDRG
jgi:exodeoxyribonuclease VII large subunit